MNEREGEGGREEREGEGERGGEINRIHIDIERQTDRQTDRYKAPGEDYPA